MVVCFDETINAESTIALFKQLEQLNVLAVCIYVICDGLHPLEAAQNLNPGVTFEQLNAIAYTISDNVAARLLNEARTALFDSINQTQQPAA